MDSSKYISRLKGRKVLVIGGSSGLGYAAAEACIENGMTVVISSSSPSKVDNAISRVLKAYPSARNRISGFACDVGNQETLESNVIDLFEKVGKLDHIIYTAGDTLSALSQPLDQITVESAIKSHVVRYFAPMMVGKHAKKYLSAGPYSSITFTSAAITLRPVSNRLLANGVMHALEGIAQQLALELAPIRVNVVLPGPVMTELWSGMSDEIIAGVKAKIESTAPTQRMAQPEDVAEAYLYALKDPNLAGAVLKTDSGNSLK